MLASASKTRKAIAIAIGAALAAVIVAPIALSSQDLVQWATSPDGLHLALGWAWFTFIALDLAAVVCIGMVVTAAIRAEKATAFQVLTWLFALGSAYANHRHSLRTPAADDDWFFPAMSITGPLLLELVLAKLRKWVRDEQGATLTARPRFGQRWIPGVALKETLAAWAASRRENITTPEDAIAYVRERAALEGMSDVEAVRYAWAALGNRDAYAAMRWLQARGRNVRQAAVDKAAKAAAAVPAIPPVPPRDDDPTAAVPAAGDHVTIRSHLMSLPSNSARIRHAFAAIGSDDVRAAVAWLTRYGIKVRTEYAYSVRRAARKAA